MHLSETELLLGTVIGRYTDGIKIQLDGDDQPLDKLYKTMLTSHAMSTGDRVVVLKMSGTYIALGALGAPQSRYYLDPLSTSATLAQCITQLNNIENILRNNHITVRR